VYLTDDHLADDAKFKLFPPHAVHATAGAEIIPQLAPRPDELRIPKRRYSGFFGTDLDITLRERGVDTLRLVGRKLHAQRRHIALPAGRGFDRDSV
jgi:nicotinamidase-related amidase